MVNNATSNGIDGLDIMLSMGRTHPSRSCLDFDTGEIATIRWICKWRVDTIEMPVQFTVVAGDDVAATDRRLATGIAENCVTFGVTKLLVVGQLIIVIADTPSLAGRLVRMSSMTGR